MSDICGGYPPMPCPTHGHPDIGTAIHGGTAFTGSTGTIALVVAIGVLLVIGLLLLRQSRRWGQ